MTEVGDFWPSTRWLKNSEFITNLIIKVFDVEIYDDFLKI